MTGSRLKPRDAERILAAASQLLNRSPRSRQQSSCRPARAWVRTRSRPCGYVVTRRNQIAAQNNTAHRPASEIRQRLPSANPPCKTAARRTHLRCNGEFIGRPLDPAVAQGYRSRERDIRKLSRSPANLQVSHVAALRVKLKQARITRWCTAAVPPPRCWRCQGMGAVGEALLWLVRMSPGFCLGRGFLVETTPSSGPF